MIGILLFGLAALWLWSVLAVPVLGQVKDTVVFAVRGHAITMWQVLVVTVILALIGLLPSPIREIIGILLIIWVSAILGYVFSTGSSTLVLVLIMVGDAVYLSKMQ